MAKRILPVGEVYGLLEPGPVVLLSTAHRGRIDVMTLSWHMMMEFEPPLVGCLVSNRNFSFELLRKSGEGVINIPTVELAGQVVAVGNCCGREVDKFAAFGLTARPAKRVQAPLVGECYANLECRVTDRRLVNRYNLFILEVVQAWVDPAVKAPRTLHHRGNGVFMIAGETLKLRSKMK